MTELDKIRLKKSTVLPTDLTIAETERRINKSIADLYIEFWDKGLTPKYRDDRCKSDNEFISVNADGSEDLSLFHSENRIYTFLRQLASPGQGEFDHLTERMRQPLNVG